MVVSTARPVGSFRNHAQRTRFGPAGGARSSPVGAGPARPVGSFRNRAQRTRFGPAGGARSSPVGAGPKRPVRSFGNRAQRTRFGPAGGARSSPVGAGPKRPVGFWLIAHNGLASARQEVPGQSGLCARGGQPQDPRYWLAAPDWPHMTSGLGCAAAASRLRNSFPVAGEGSGFALAAHPGGSGIESLRQILFAKRLAISTWRGTASA